MQKTKKDNCQGTAYTDWIMADTPEAELKAAKSMLDFLISLRPSLDNNKTEVSKQ